MAAAIYLISSYVLKLLFLETILAKPETQLFALLLPVIPCTLGAVFLAARSRTQWWWLHGLIYSTVPTFVFCWKFITDYNKDISFSVALGAFFFIGAFWQISSSILTMITMIITKGFIRLARTQP